MTNALKEQLTKFWEKRKEEMKVCNEITKNIETVIKILNEEYGITCKKGLGNYINVSCRINSKSIEKTFYVEKEVNEKVDDMVNYILEDIYCEAFELKGDN